MTLTTGWKIENVNLDGLCVCMRGWMNE